MKKKLLAILLFLLPVVARAEIGVVALIEGEPTPSNPTAVPISTVEIDGLYYNLYDTNLAEVTHNPSVLLMKDVTQETLSSRHLYLIKTLIMM